MVFLAYMGERRYKQRKTMPKIIKVMDEEGLLHTIRKI